MDVVPEIAVQDRVPHREIGSSSSICGGIIQSMLHKYLRIKHSSVT